MIVFVLLVDSGSALVRDLPLVNSLFCFSFVFVLISELRRPGVLQAEPHSHHGKEKETYEGFSHGYHG